MAYSTIITQHCKVGGRSYCRHPVCSEVPVVLMCMQLLKDPIHAD
jgi:hypothetical protein